MNLLPLTIALALVVPALHASPDSSSAALIEYSYGYFGEGGPAYFGPFLVPPRVTIYQGGRIVFVDEHGAWQGTVKTTDLKRLEESLARNPLLQETRVVPVKRGRFFGMHGGMSYIRYRNGTRDVLVGSMKLPSGGPWRRLLREIQSVIPSDYSSFEPEVVQLRVGPNAWGQPVGWPFTDKLPLHELLDGESFDADDPQVVTFIMANLDFDTSGLSLSVSENGATYSIGVTVPDWFEPYELGPTLGRMAVEHYEAQ